MDCSHLVDAERTGRAHELFINLCCLSRFLLPRCVLQLACWASRAVRYLMDMPEGDLSTFLSYFEAEVEVVDANNVSGCLRANRRSKRLTSQSCDRLAISPLIESCR